MGRIQGKCSTEGCNNLQKALYRQGGRPFYSTICRRCRDRKRRLRYRQNKRDKSKQRTEITGQKIETNTTI